MPFPGVTERRVWKAVFTERCLCARLSAGTSYNTSPLYFILRTALKGLCILSVGKTNVEKVYTVLHLVKSRTPDPFPGLSFLTTVLHCHWADEPDRSGGQWGLLRGSHVWAVPQNLSKGIPVEWGEEGHFRQKKGGMGECDITEN